jgi:pyruvate formate lyase activating enzyme
MHRLTPFLINGGITISGGEPLMQPEFLQELLSCLKPLHTVVETSGYARPEVFRMAANACDIIYLDIKHPDSERHRRLTGVGNELILENLRWLKEREQPFLVRIPLIPGCNDDSASLAAAGDLLAGAVNLTGVELMPMNPYAEAKYKMVGMDYPLKSYREKDAAGFVCGSASVSPEEAAAIFTRRGLKSKVLEI